MLESAALLTADTVGEYLGELGILDSPHVFARSLGGGVSNVVLEAQDGSRSVVVKQALPRLRVADDWFAPQDRVMAEAAALQLVARIAPGSVPQVLHRNPDLHALVLERAPDDWSDWKSLLLQGNVDPNVAARLGVLLGQIQRKTWGVDLNIGSAEAFEALRVDPYYRTAATRSPDVARLLTELTGRMTARRDCLVHGDFSPKNVLVGPAIGGIWLIDFEVAHIGDSRFDVAFLLSHLVLKAIHRPQNGDAYFSCASIFVESYQETSGRTDLDVDTFMHLGALLLARVRGKSPAEYLSAAEQNTAVRLALGLLRSPAVSVRELLERCERASR